LFAEKYHIIFRLMKQFILLFLLGGLSSVLFSQEIDPSVLQYVKEHNFVYSTNKSTGFLNFIRFGESNVMIALPEDARNHFLQQYGFLFGVHPSSIDLRFVKSISDTYGFRHYYYQQFYHDIPVFGGDFRLHFNPYGQLQTANGVVLPNIDCTTIPVISGVDALHLAEATLKEKYDIDTELKLMDTIQLMIYRDGLVQGFRGRDYLVYYMELQDESRAIRTQVFVDALKGNIVAEFSKVHEALTRELYNMNLSTLIWQEGDPFPGALNIYEQNEVAAAGHTYYLFKNAFGRLSYDGADATMKTIHDNPGISCPNANWNGTTTNFCTNTASDDVVAHEWGHAYTEYTSHLIYGWQSGALNESYSDIWGETVDLINGYEDAGEDLSLRNACGSSLRWMMGEDAGGFGGAIRDMWDPTCKGDPGKVSDSQYRCSAGDAGGVHTNSGVSNHAYALLVDGGTYNGQTITGLGFTKAAHIYYRSQAFYLTNTSDFSVQAAALESACNDLLGINLEGLSTTSTPAGPSGEIITMSDCNQVSAVNLAVEFANPPPCSFAPMLDPNTPAICPSGTGAQTIFFDDFESGIGSWIVTQHPSNPATWDSREWTIQGGLPDGRAGNAIVCSDPVVGDCNTDLDNGLVRLQTPVISIPGTATANIKLSFSHYASMEAKWDGGNLKYSINGGAWTIIPSARFIFNAYNDVLNTSGNDNPMKGEVAFTGANEGSVSGSWGESQIDLSGLGLMPGDNLQLRWELGTDGCNGWDGWYLDDVLVCSCEAALPVELSDFSAYAKDKSIILSWQTEVEIGNKGFYLQRKGVRQDDFRNIAWVDGVGNSHSRQHYHFIDEYVQPDKRYYYRLAQIDVDGDIQYSGMVTAMVPGRDFVDIYPNPAGRELFVASDRYRQSPLVISLLNQNGGVLKTWYFAGTEKSVHLLLDEIPSGIYLLKIRDEQVTTVKRVVILY